MEVGEQHEAGAEVAELLGLRLLDLQHEVTAFPHRVGAGDDLGAGAAVVVVGDARIGPGARLDHDRHVAMRHLEHAVGGDGDAVLVGLHLTGNADHERRRARPGLAERHGWLAR